jgi:ATP-binding cassette subfamily F protein 3
MSDSDVLLLDEPTNHLDIEAIVWLESYLKNYRGTLILISHDRDFLDSIVDTVAHIDQKKIKRYTGNYTGFETLRAQHLMLQQALFEKQQEKIAHLMSFVNRFRAKASKAKQAQSRLKAIDRIETVAAVQMASSFTFEFRQPKNVGDPIVYFESVSIGYESRDVLKNISLSIRKGNRIGLLGPNGAGKSTLIKCLAGELQPKKGHITMAQGCGIGYFAQHQLEQLFLDETPLQHMRRIDQRTSELELRKFLGTFNFSGPMALSPIQHFSGGEKARLSLAMLVWHSPNLLLLDEPTNHFDMDMREALTLALQSYEGAMVLVSHDRHMLRSTVDEFYLVADGKVSIFDGDVDDYYRWFLEYKARENAADTAVSTAPKERNMYQFNKEQKKLTQQLKTLEGKISSLRNQLKDIEAQLTESSLYEASQQRKLNELLQQQNLAAKEVQKLEEDWVNLSMKLES